MARFSLVPSFLHAYAHTPRHTHNTVTDDELINAAKKRPGSASGATTPSSAGLCGWQFIRLKIPILVCVLMWESEGAACGATITLWPCVEITWATAARWTDHFLPLHRLILLPDGLGSRPGHCLCGLWRCSHQWSKIQLHTLVQLIWGDLKRSINTFRWKKPPREYLKVCAPCDVTKCADASAIPLPGECEHQVLASLWGFLVSF